MDKGDMDKLDASDDDVIVAKVLQTRTETIDINGAPNKFTYADVAIDSSKHSTLMDKLAPVFVPNDDPADRRRNATQLRGKHGHHDSRIPRRLQPIPQIAIRRSRRVQSES